MAPLAVDPEALDDAGSTVISAGESLGSVISTLTTALGGCNGMAGDDPAGAAFGNSYNTAASKLLEAMSTTRNGLCRLGDGVRMSAHNYSTAEAMSNISGHGQPLRGPHPTGSILAQSVPSAVGSGVSAPTGWGWVSKYIGMIWPSGDSAKLRAAAAAWISAGTGFEVSEVTGAVGPMATIGAQQIPEVSAIAAAFADANRSTAAILQQCNTIAIQLNSLAARIDSVHAAILDLLSRICDPLTGIKEVWEFLTDQDEDEIKKIARDIRTIVDQFTAEVQALSHQIATAVTEASTILSTMGRYAEREWDQFLHHTDVGRALNQVGQFGKGLGEEVGDLVKDAWTYGPLREFSDPQGFQQSWKELLHGMAPLVGLGDEHAPGVAQSWKDVGKNAVHWDEWSTNPAEAAGKSTFDIATLLVPGGGEAAAAAKGGRATADAAEAASAASRAEAAATRALEDAPKPHAPASAPQLPHPEPHPTSPPIDRPPPPTDKSTGPVSTKPTSAPTDAPAPHSPTESTPPATASASHEPVALARSSSHEPIGHGGQPGEGGSNFDRANGAEGHDAHPSDGEPPNPDGPNDPPPLLHREEPLPGKELLDQYEGENDASNPNRHFWPNTVEYLSSEDLEKHRLFVKDGLIYSARDGLPFDTSSAGTVWNQGRAIYVVDQHGNLYASLVQQVGRFHHSSFLGGNPVASAGEIEVRDGVLNLINRKSGHYQPNPEQLSQIRGILEEQGLDTSNIFFGAGF